MVFLTSTAECFFRPFHDVENSLGDRGLVKSTASTRFTFSVARFEGIDQLGVTVYRQVGIVRSHSCPKQLADLARDAD